MLSLPLGGRHIVVDRQECSMASSSEVSDTKEVETIALRRGQNLTNGCGSGIVYRSFDPFSS